MRALWAQILQEDASNFSEDDGFFDLGGNSITAQTLATAAQAQGIFLTVEQIFLHVTLEEMAQEAVSKKPQHSNVTGALKSLKPFGLLNADISMQEQIEGIGKACAVAADRVENAYPCTPMQESLVSLSEGDENLSVRQLVYKLSDEFPVDQFQQAWAATVRANPVLRTRICYLNGALRFVQAVINEDVLWNISVTSLDRFLEEDANDPMNLGDRFFRWTIIVDNDRRYFVWTVHHALCDGASLIEILNDLSTRFEHEPAIQRVSFEQFIESTIQTDSSQEQEFWERTLSSLDMTAFPAVPQTLEFHANPSSTLERPITLPERAPFGLTKALLLRGAWGILMSHHAGTENVVFGAINNG